MFSRSILVAFLSLALAVQAIPQQNQQQKCAAPSTVVRTVTVTARGAAAPTNNANTNTNKGNNNNANNNGKGGNGTQATSTKAAGSKTTSTAATAAAGGKGGKGGDPQKSTTLDPGVIASGFANDGQDVPTAGQVASLTSTNNFINFCLTVPNLPITNGKQITTGSCNPAPIGVIPSTDNMPSSKFTFPPNFGTIKAGQTFTIEMAIQNLQTGFFVNAQANYFAAPQQLNKQGQIQGHSHVVVEQLSSIDQTTPTDPKKFAFFKGLNAAAVGGKLTASVPNGLAAGVYKLSSINTAANHQPAIVPVAQHGALDDAIYFIVTPDGKPLQASGASGGKQATTAVPPLKASGASGGKQATAPVTPLKASGASGGKQATAPVTPLKASGASGGKQATAPVTPLKASGASGGKQATTPVTPLNASGASGGKQAQNNNTKNQGRRALRNRQA